ncbi:rCG22956, isoform CRA_a [Rattus norvegicus]|uniref:RCG22956, isoform CRA_a n=1 Tax=Rattus norvegicus TaxID=10116 RepID=A6KBA1_RAT|nr:rCG22956, isoform CRA_a [Rattus norvegicus]EDL99764.1 rCG22956, isoform CRA_a [Rattus norvegicus]
MKSRTLSSSCTMPAWTLGQYSHLDYNGLNL